MQTKCYSKGKLDEIFPFIGVGLKNAGLEDIEALARIESYLKTHILRCNNCYKEYLNYLIKMRAEEGKSIYDLDKNCLEVFR